LFKAFKVYHVLNLFQIALFKVTQQPQPTLEEELNGEECSFTSGDIEGENDNCDNGTVPHNNPLEDVVKALQLKVWRLQKKLSAANKEIQGYKRVLKKNTFLPR
jgi:Neuraminidase (sialidase)